MYALYAPVVSCRESDPYVLWVSKSSQLKVHLGGYLSDVPRTRTRFSSRLVCFPKNPRTCPYLHVSPSCPPPTARCFLMYAMILLMLDSFRAPPFCASNWDFVWNYMELRLTRERAPRRPARRGPGRRASWHLGVQSCTSRTPVRRLHTRVSTQASDPCAPTQRAEQPRYQLTGNGVDRQH